MPQLPYQGYNKYPLGLLGLLDAKIQGKTPNELAQFTQPTLDLAQFLLEQGAEVRIDDTAAVAANALVLGAASTLRVPEDEIWYVHAFTARPTADLLAGTTYEYTGAQKTTLAVGTFNAGQFARTSTATATAGFRTLAGNGRPFLMAPGDELGLWVTRTVLGTAATFSLFAKFSRLRV